MPLLHFGYKLKCIKFSAELRSSGSIAGFTMQSSDPTALLLAILVQVEAQQYFQHFIDDGQDDENIASLSMLKPTKAASRYRMPLNVATAFIEECRCRSSSVVFDRAFVPSQQQLEISSKALPILPTESELITIAQARNGNIVSFRSKQCEVILNILAGKHTVAVLATSTGKTLIWLLAGCVLSQHFSAREKVGMTLVLCPLQSLVAEHAAKSEAWGSVCSSCDDLQLFKTKITNAVYVYTTAEKLTKNTYFRELVLAQADRIVCIVRDEAHIWIDDYRPALAEASKMLYKAVPNITHLAVTATLDCNVDIVPSLGMPSTSCIVRCTVNRENCFMHVIAAQDKKGCCDRDSVTILQKVNVDSRPQALVFVTTQKDSTAMAAALQAAIRAANAQYVAENEVAFYHSALDADQKKTIQENFRSGNLRIVVCTSSFGTGLDYPSIRIIFHCTIPPSVSELLQNIGRGGRDGLPYHCYLFFSYKRIHECAQTWMTAQPYTQEQLEKKWNMFVQMVKYTM